MRTLPRAEGNGVVGDDGFGGPGLQRPHAVQRQRHPPHPGEVHLCVAGAQFCLGQQPQVSLAALAVHILSVHWPRGNVVATLAHAPPVYDPGGLNCQIDDFVVAPAARWPATGAELLRAALAEAGRRGAIQAVVVTGHLDQPKRQALRACGLEIASEWWVTPQALPC